MSIEFHPYKLGVSIEWVYFPEDTFDLPDEIDSKNIRLIKLGRAFYITICLLFWDITVGWEE